MFGRAFVRLCVLALLLQAQFISYSAIASDVPDNGATLAARSRSTAEIVLDHANPTARAFGLELTLPPGFNGRDSVRVQVGCYAAEDTPTLALDAKAYSEDNRLVNTTDKREFGCSSYQVNIADSVNQPASVQIDADTHSPAQAGIAISVPNNLPASNEEMTAPAVFIFNPVHGNWTSVRPFRAAEPDPKRTYATLIEQRQRIISGVIVLPGKLTAEPAKSAPSTISEPLAQLKPTTGYLSLGDIAPDSKGAYTQKLPLYLRPSRGPGPSISVVYSSSGAAGVLGRGWDLKVSSISVRGPAPIYHPDFETEDYSLDGQDLIAVDSRGNDIPSLYKGGPIIARVKGERVFRLRNNSAGLIVRRFGDGPNSYRWLVWDPHSKRTRLYGGHRDPNPSSNESGFELPTLNGDGNGLLRGVVSFGGPRSRTQTVIGEWGLTQEYDNQPAKSGSWYVYGSADEPCEPSLGEGCSPALRLEEVVYNLTFGQSLDQTADAGVTLVELQWDKRYRRSPENQEKKKIDTARFNTDGRLGFVRAYEYWLSQIDVRYTIVHDQLTYPYTSAFPQDIFEKKFEKVFSKHSFVLSDGSDECTDFDILLTSYVVEPSEAYDLNTSLSPKSQTFGFQYEGQDHCKKAWEPPQQVTFEGAPDKAPATNLGFPADALERVGLGSLAEASILGTGQSDETGASLYMGVGPIGDVFEKPISGGIKGGTLQTRSEVGSTLVDVTGDGISDIVFRSNNGFRYCAGERHGTEVAYPSARCGDVFGIPDLGVSSSSVNSAGAELYAFNAFVGVGYNESSNDTYVYFTDRDGDGLADLIAYGKIYYGLGEDADKKSVRFSPDKALTPPLPARLTPQASAPAAPGILGQVSLDLSQRVPEDLEDTVAKAGRKLENTTRKLDELDYSQTTILWEAPLDGRVKLSGSLVLYPGSRDFPTLKADADRLGQYYYDCSPRPYARACYDAYAYPYEPHYVEQEGDIHFIDTPKAYVQISLSPRQPGKQVVVCAEAEIAVGHPVDLGALAIMPVCRGASSAAGSDMTVRSRDALFITYSVDPDSTARLRPSANVKYVWVDNDYAFNFTTGSQPDTISPLLKCGWADQGSAAFQGKCLLRSQSRYTYDLETGGLTSTAGRVVELKSGSDRVFNGEFEIPTSITQDYDVYYEVFVSEDLHDTTLPSEFPLVFRQSISDACRAAGDLCVVEIRPRCATDSPRGSCQNFYKKDAPAARLTSRISVQHKGMNGYEVRNISSRLNRLRWVTPPHIKSVFTEGGNASPGIPKQPGDAGDASAYRSVVYLPVTLGDDDIEYGRVENGLFPEPNPDLNEASGFADKIDYSTILKAEHDNVKVARARQTSQLCGYVLELIDFLDDRYAAEYSPFAGNYSSYWKKEQAIYAEPCRISEEYLRTLHFTTPDSPDFSYRERLNLPHLLRNLPPAEQISSAETLLDRAFKNLKLPGDLLTDEPTVTRRGYRLPAKVNPEGCDILSSGAQPVDQPIFGAESACKYRMLVNFAMTLKAGQIDALLSQLSNSPRPAFNLQLTATVNGTPILFNELSGEAAGNVGCHDAPKNTCIGNYGSFDQLKGHLYPDLNGDMFQRVVTNRRTGRAVAFSDDVMDLRHGGWCIASGKRYLGDAAMEVKQDCSLLDAMKYVKKDQAEIGYQILENNQFVGRNRVIEFEASPLDILELHLELSPVTQTVTIGSTTVRGNFSVFDVDASLSQEIGIKKGRHLIPRSPFDLVSETSVAADCPAPIFNDPLHPRPNPERLLPVNCRPWTKLGWTEILFGAQYRTLSDAHNTIDQRSFSILRRRDILRLNPEIEVKSNSYRLQFEKGSYLPIAEDIWLQRGQKIAEETAKGVSAASNPLIPSTPITPPSLVLAEIERTPNVAKVGADWGFFASRHGKDGRIQKPVGYDDIRYGVLMPDRPLNEPEKTFDGALAACGGGHDPGAKGFQDCKIGLGAQGEAVLGLRAVNVIPLVHQFHGPVSDPRVGAAVPSHLPTGASECMDPVPVAMTSCWKGQDDSIFLERKINGRVGASQSPINSVSALVGFEDPPISRFKSEYDVLCKLLSNDDSLPPDVCAGHRLLSIAAGPVVHGVPPGDAILPNFPNRPAPPSKDRAIQVFAPVQGSESRTISINGGVAFVNADKSWTTKETKQLFMDVNGDGYPDAISNGVADLTSPVGMSRKDWWRFFRVDAEAPGLSGELVAGGLSQSNKSESSGAGIGLSPYTFARAETKGTHTAVTGSTDGSVEPSFDLSFDQGHVDNFNDLKDFNGDGIADEFNAADPEISTGISVSLSNGNRLGDKEDSSAPDVNHPNLQGFKFQNKFDTSHGAGFGVRLGYAYASGSVLAGMGISHRDSASEGALMDFNGDGRVDVVLPATKDGANYLTVFPNLGNGYGPARLYKIDGWQNSETGASETTQLDSDVAFTFGVDIPIIFIKIVWTPSVKFANDQTRELIQIRDMDGDGAPDIATVSGRFRSADENGIPTLSRFGSVQTRVHHNPDARYHLLSGITEPGGTRYYLSYGLFGNTGPEHGTAVWALTSVGRYDGYEPAKAAPMGKLALDGQDIDLRLYTYSGGYFNRAERQFYGFSERTMTRYGCDLAFDSPTESKGCLNVLAMQDPPTESSLVGTAYRKLQVIKQEYSNRDYLTQGLLLSETDRGFESAPQVTNQFLSDESVAPQLVSRSMLGYSIDDLASLSPAPKGDGQCVLPSLEPGSAVGWVANKADDPSSLQTTTSQLSTQWNGAEFHDNGVVLGKNSICGEGVAGCAALLKTKICQEGFVREQTAFWGQQSGSVRQRFSLLQTFGDGEQDENAPHLTSAVGFDHDQWGQILRFDSVGETLKSADEGTPISSSSVHAKIDYSQRQGPNSRLGTSEELRALGYPMLDLPESIEIYSGPWADPGKDTMPGEPLRAREALYANDGTANLTDICLYPGGDGFLFRRDLHICQTYKVSMQKALQDGYSTLETALRSTYANTTGLPKGVDRFNAIIHHHLAGYDAFGNLTHAVSPLSEGKEWIERRFDYSVDPFLMSPTTTELTRCVEDVPGAGTDSPRLRQAEKSRCTYGLDALNSVVVRKPITHFSDSRIDPHLGVVAESQDINGNSLLYDYDRWGRLRLMARSWGEAPREQKTFEKLLETALKKTLSALRNPSAPVDVNEWKILSLADYGKTSEGLLRSSVRRFEPSDSYSGFVPGHSSTRETAAISDGLGHLVQSIQEADVCEAALNSIIDGANPGPRADLAHRCEGVATGMVTPGTATDVLGRALQTFEPYAAITHSAPHASDLRFTALEYRPSDRSAISSTTYDAAGRPIKVENRLSKAEDVGDGQIRLIATSQYHYRVLPETDDRGTRFESLSLSPRCAANSIWADARGQTTDVFENQDKFYGMIPTPPQPSARYGRDYEHSLGKCFPIETAKMQWDEDVKSLARVSYLYDPLQQLTKVDYPLDGTDRAHIEASYDDFGRMTEMREANAGCVQYRYDGLQNLMSEIASKYQPNAKKPCEAASKVRNEKSYRYSAERLLEMSYRSLEERGGAKDQADRARFFYDRFPYSVRHGELIEALKFVPNDLANERFVDQTGLNCQNCIGQVAIVADRTGASSRTYNEWGLPSRELRSIVGPVRNVKQSDGGSETYLPEIGFYEQDNSYTSFGDLSQQEFGERAPMNPSLDCLKAGIETCLAHFTLGRRYGPDGTIAQLLYNSKPLINSAHDALSRPAVRWTADGTVTGFAYDDKDLRMDQLATITAGKEAEKFVPVQVNGYQYDGGGNVLGYANSALPREDPHEDYESVFDFTYDPVNRLTSFDAKVRKGTARLEGTGNYAYDAGNRIKSQGLTIAGIPGEVFKRHWDYHYNDVPHDDVLGKGPVHAPASIEFAINSQAPRTSLFAYDDIGRMTRIETGEPGKEMVLGVLSNRGLIWDAEGRLTGVRGAIDGAIKDNAEWLREDYVYDYGGNRVLKIHRPLAPKKHEGTASDDAKQVEEGEAVTIYMTPYYARGMDGHGAVQIAEGNLPKVSLSLPADQSEDPVATYLYSDLAVGSVSASVTAFGEVDDANSTVVGRREYGPYGLELTADGLAKTGRDGVAPLSVFHGKELDRVTGFSSFGARSYSRDLGLWLSPDPILRDYLAGLPNGGVYEMSNIAPYSFAADSPVLVQDATGLSPCGPNQICAAPDTFWNRHPTLGKLIGDRVAIYNYHGDLAFNPLTNRALLPREEQNEQLLHLLLSVVTFAAPEALMASTTARGVEATATAEKGITAAIDANRLHHIFGDVGHNLGPLVQQLGSEEAAFTAIKSATETAVKARSLTGVFETIVDVAGAQITVRGAVVEGAVKIGTAFIPPPL
ncbi:hypothetical protein LB515_02555 [Mesorhizobium sp. CA15]|uniref:SpvB/TcaC N-terminal domain-containing protein n=1 Tax=Mesorhizobium sp. CA15 TaxID=2876641 RepID=UPI001CD12974|nr:SpvB/TcaC N-terminal domain-containing protein [Mesorhizobium sp. CA15]MBZ9864248.1 hypothetical protein [Mesorhizobium sp. CA15]